MWLANGIRIYSYILGKTVANLGMGNRVPSLDSSIYRQYLGSYMESCGSNAEQAVALVTPDYELETVTVSARSRKLVVVIRFTIFMQW